MIKAIVRFFKFIIETTELGFYYICLVFSEGFFFYFYILSSLMGKIIRIPFFQKMKNYFKKKQKDPVAFLMLVLFFFVGVFLYTYLYVDHSEVKYVDEGILEKKEDTEETEDNSLPKEEEEVPDVGGNEINMYRKYGKYDINSVDFSMFDGQGVVAWIMVDGTGVNYPIVQTDNNDFYLNHDIERNPKASGWTFMDYRNSPNLDDSNTIFYGHNLLNKTAFGSLSNVFTDKWFQNSNHYIVVRTPNVRHVYQVFSCYYIDPEVYYLQTNFYRKTEYQQFLDTLKGRSKYDFGIEVTSDDSIITLSTCTDDNKGRKVVHAKMIE